MSFHETNEFKLFHDLIGHYLAVQLMESAISNNRVAPAYLFSGPEGVGRRLAVMRFLEGVITGGFSNSRERKRIEDRNHPDLIWVEPTYQHQGRLITKTEALNEGISRPTSPQIRLEQIRKVSTFLGRSPLETKRGMVVIESVESMGEGASNALLKTLEEPGHGLIILLTKATGRLLSTIRSRCQEITFRPLNVDDLEVVLQKQEFEEVKNLFKKVSKDQLLNLACGSPGALISHGKLWNSIPEEILSRLNNFPKYPLDALALARDITDNLNGEQQLWLIDWFQLSLWNSSLNEFVVRKLDRLRIHLKGYVQPRLAWEVTLLAIMNSD